MIATKASRVVQAAGGSDVVDFGLRRAQGPDGALSASKAAYVGGCVATSNVLAGKAFNIPVRGTHAHSYIMSYKTELEAFRAYANSFPDSSVLLVDTYDTVQGIKNAIIVGKELETFGRKLVGIRLDSGDLSALSKIGRALMDDAGLDYVKIVASNDLNEHKITALNALGACIDSYGVGTELVTAKPIAAISGVYKLVHDKNGGRMKFASGKKSYPGIKNVLRKIQTNGRYANDVICLEDELDQTLECGLLTRQVLRGQRKFHRRSMKSTRSHSLECVSRLPISAKRLKEPREFGVSISTGVEKMIEDIKGGLNHG
jgi:nicotinate phosphoribosyltransferase